MDKAPTMPILATKLHVPAPRARYVVRPRLMEQLKAALQGRLTLVAAPAGFGKTTLISTWLAEGARPIAWLSLDESDSDASRFLTYLIAALQTILPGMGEGILRMLHAPQPPETELLVTSLLNEIAAISEPVTLVLDDYHLIDAKEVDAALAFLIEHQPPQLHLVISTREDPQLPLARLRARGQLTELRAADLRFSATEAATFLNQVMGLTLAAAEVAALEARTEGWIAGLQLAALSLQGRADAAQFVKAFAGDHRYIVDYLVDEVLQHQPPPIQEFLLRSSILERLCGPLCAAVTEQSDSQEILEGLERSNLFVVPLDDERRWFRYHHLFADVLAAHLRQKRPADAAPLHQRASVWYAQNNMAADAIRHALAANDFAHAADLVELAWPAMDGTFQSATWLGWARHLPDALVHTRPVLSAAYGWAHLNAGAIEAADSRLRDAEAWLEAAPAAGAESGAHAQPMVVVDEEQFRTLPGSIATARAYMALALGDVPACVRYSSRALELLPAHASIQRGPAASLLGLAYWASGDLEAAHRALDDAMASFARAGNINFAISGTYGLAEIRSTQGQLRAAVNVYEDALRLALAQGEPPPRGTADLYLGLSELARERGEADAAARFMRDCERLGKAYALPDWHFRLCRTQARFKADEGDFDAALALLTEAERHYLPTPVPDARPLAAWKARIHLAQGQLRAARRWVQQRALSTEDELSYLHEFEHVTLAHLLLAEYRAGAPDSNLHAAIDLLERLLRAAEAGERIGSAIEIGALLALAHHAQHDTDAALAVLATALQRAEPEGYLRIFVDEGPPMARLLAEAAARGLMPEYVAQLQAALVAQVEVAADMSQLSSHPPSASRSSAPSPNDSLIEPLSARELEILQLISLGLSNDEIAARLFIALSTVKGHNRNIFGKLQVQRRTEAVARARALGLL